ncbi:MAG: ATP-binding cassette domain-containing protein [Cytophagaceae bacterium]|jgi:cell division transport system ATP-binding protein|nr:ATP-binding cassette domain-containing protein [Cytophagaceae bacterium]
MFKNNINTTNSTGNIIELSDVMIRQEEHIILRNVNLMLQSGEFLYLTGRVGSGKSSLLKTLYCEIPLLHGTGFVLGYDLHNIKIKQVPWLRRKIGIIFQDFQLLIDRNVYENLIFVLKATGWKNKTEMDHRVREVLSEVDMVHKGYKMPHQLSGGEQQRIGIARALLNEPELILADEPTGNLDPDASDDLMKLLNRISGTGKAIIMATHNYNLIKKFQGKTLRCEDTHLFEPVSEINNID